LRGISTAKSKAVVEAFQKASSSGRQPTPLIDQERARAIFVRNNWNILDVISELHGMGIKKRTEEKFHAFFIRIGCGEMHKSKFIEKNREYGGSTVQLGGFFGVEKRAVASMKIAFMKRPTRAEVLRLCKKHNWALKEIEKALQLYVNGRGLLNDFETLGCLDILVEKIQEVHIACKGNITKIAETFNVRRDAMDRWLLDKRLKPSASKFTREDTERILQEHNWALYEALGVLRRYGRGKYPLTVLRDIGHEDVLYRQLLSVYVDTGYDLLAVSRFFGFSAREPFEVAKRAKYLIDGMRRDIARRSKAQQAPIRDKEIKALFVRNGWNIKKSCNELSRLYGIRRHGSYIQFLDRLGATHILKEEFIRVYAKECGKIKEVARRFGVPAALIHNWKKRLTPRNEEVASKLEESGWSISVAFGHQDNIPRRFYYHSQSVACDIIFTGLGLYDEFRERLMQEYLKAGLYFEGVSDVVGLDNPAIGLLLRGPNLWPDILQTIKSNTGIDTSERGLIRFCNDKSWNMPLIIKGLGIRYGTGIVALFENLGIIDALRQELRRVYAEKGYNKKATAEYFHIGTETINSWLKRLDIVEDISREKAAKRASMDAAAIRAVFESCKWNMPDAVLAVSKRGICRTRGESYADFLSRPAIFGVFALEFREKNKSLKGDVQGLSDIFGVSASTIDDFRSKFVQKPSKAEVKKILIKNKWKIESVISDLHEFVQGNDIIVILKSLGYLDLLKDEFTRLCREYEYSTSRLAEHFGVSQKIVRNWFKLFGLEEDVKAHKAKARAVSRLSPQQQALNELVENGAIESIATACRSPKRAFGVLASLHRDQVDLPDLAQAVQSVYDDADRGDVDRQTGQMRAGPRLSFKAMREVEWPERYTPDQLTWLTNTTIQLAYSNLAYDPNFLMALEAQSNNPENPPMVQAAYKNTIAYYSDLLETVEEGRIKGIDQDKIPLRLYQVAGINFILEQRRVMLADEPGMGKTIQAIAAALNANNGRGAKRTLIVCPSGAKHIWEDEIRDGTIMDNPTTVISGKASKRAEELAEAANSRFVVVHYEALRSPELVKGLKALGFDFTIVDEAHEMRNETLHTKALREFDTAYKVLITATPLIGRSVTGFFNLLNWLRPDRFPQRAGFIRRYTSTSKEKRDEKAMELNLELSEFMLRRYKEDALSDLPPKTDVTLEAVLEGTQDRIYTSLWSNYRAYCAQAQRASPKGPGATVLAKITEARQAAIDTGILKRNPVESESAKLKKLDELIRFHRARGEKVVVFTNFVNAAKKVQSMYADQGALAIYGGRTSQNRRAEAAFQEDNMDCPILVCSTRSGGVSRNFSRANVVIHLDQQWVPEIEDQASDRVHRFGQTKPVTIYRIVAKDTVDEHINNVLAEARWLSYVTIDGMDRPGANELFMDRIIREDTDLDTWRREVEAKEDALKREPALLYTYQQGDCTFTLTQNAQWQGSFGDLAFNSFDDLLLKAGFLTDEQKQRLRSIVFTRVRYELSEAIPLRQSMLWPLFTHALPYLERIDIDPKMQQFDIAREIISRIMGRPNLTSRGLRSAISGGGQDIPFTKALYMLDRYNLFMALSTLGILPEDYYYMGNSLDYTHPIVLIAQNGQVYRDTHILRAIHPEAFENGHNTPVSSDLSDAAFIMHCKNMAIPCDRAAEIRLCREIERGNIDAPGVFLQSNFDMVAHAAFSVGKQLQEGRAGERTMPVISKRDLFQEAASALYLVLPEYLRVYEREPAEGYLFQKVRKRVSGYFWSRVSGASVSTISLEQARYGDRGDEDATTWLETIPAKELEPSERVVTLDLIALAQGAIADLPEFERALFLGHAFGKTNKELADEFGISEKTVKDRIESIQKRLREGIEDKEEEFLLRIEAARKTVEAPKKELPLGDAVTERKVSQDKVRQPIANTPALKDTSESPPSEARVEGAVPAQEDGTEAGRLPEDREDPVDISAVIAYDDKMEVARSVGRLLESLRAFESFSNGKQAKWSVHMIGSLGIWGSARRGRSNMNILVLVDDTEENIREALHQLNYELAGMLQKQVDGRFNDEVGLPTIVVGQGIDYDRILSMLEDGSLESDLLAEVASLLQTHGIGLSRDQGILTIEAVSVDGHNADGSIDELSEYQEYALMRAVTYLTEDFGIGCHSPLLCSSVDTEPGILIRKLQEKVEVAIPEYRREALRLKAKSRILDGRPARISYSEGQDPGEELGEEDRLLRLIDECASSAKTSSAGIIREFRSIIRIDQAA